VATFKGTTGECGRATTAFGGIGFLELQANSLAKGRARRKPGKAERKREDKPKAISNKVR